MRSHPCYGYPRKQFALKNIHNLATEFFPLVVSGFTFMPEEGDSEGWSLSGVE